MKLFVFEGEKREPRIFDAIREVFLPKETEPFVCTYNSSIYSLYNKLKEHDVFGDNFGASGNTVAVLNEILLEKDDETLKGMTDADFSEIYMFFDYEIQDSRLSISEKNDRLRRMIEYFNEETENGKLYVNYPMVESICYTKELPDNEYWRYKVNISDCKTFKRDAIAFSFYHSYDFIFLPNNTNEKEEDRILRTDMVRQNWLHIKRQNIIKSNFVCSGNCAIPQKIEEISQQNILDSQIIKYVEVDKTVAILNAFPLFLYEYLGK